jgi:hypothetical protein
VDIDFFSNEVVASRVVVASLRRSFPEVEFFVAEHQVSGEVSGVRLELYDQWMVPFQSGPVEAEGLRIASLMDLAAFKLNAITERREKKDYIDLYFLFQSLNPAEVLRAFRKSNPYISSKSILFALTEVVSAAGNKSPMPDMLVSVSWKEIQRSMLEVARAWKVKLSAEKSSGFGFGT